MCVCVKSELLQGFFYLVHEGLSKETLLAFDINNLLQSHMREITLA